jgi:hypothetical protein
MVLIVCDDDIFVLYCMLCILQLYCISIYIYFDTYLYIFLCIAVYKYQKILVFLDMYEISVAHIVGV